MIIVHEILLCYNCHKKIVIEDGENLLDCPDCKYIIIVDKNKITEEEW